METMESVDVVALESAKMYIQNEMAEITKFDTIESRRSLIGKNVFAQSKGLKLDPDEIALAMSDAYNYAKTAIANKEYQSNPFK